MPSKNITKVKGLTVGQRSLFATVLTGVTVFLLAGCNDEQRLQGTTAGFKTCFEKGKQQGLQDSAIKIHCSTKHEKDYFIMLRGTARYNTYLGDVISFIGSAKNESTDYVATSFRVMLKRLDNNTIQYKDFNNLWVEPGDSAQFTIVTSELDYKPTEKEIGYDKFEWNILSTRGIKILIN